MPDLSGHVVFCEDIRSELGDQVSYIGVYPRNRGTFEVDDDGDIVLSRFALACYLAMPVEFKGESPSLTITQIDKNKREKQIASEILPEIPDRSEREVVTAMLHFQFQGVLAKPSDIIVVDLSVAGETARIGSFRFAPKKPSAGSSKPDETNP
ncbi:hypothetical protein M8997_010910 [Phyllobacterium sp. 21LDTY02-6]|jgi:hypothetical protein|uniref:hypothetical protein n=1 Tax=Phyllobacterium sp. 21LDTY02-6 TaxID=2944903 RepID=UPI002020AF8E|nr:hypothetical protein [Phyllobacterium sp. 21LDTY02-6]MCO4317694.1 hypothetical protein [Phyllobacterium sp. 21LDTY02-6]